jgi:hypothetical protein
MRRITAGLLSIALAAGGCGGSVTRDDLRQRLERYASIAAEGRLMADDVAAGRGPRVLVRVHARELAETAEDDAEELHDARASGGLDAQRVHAAELAVEIADALRELQVAPRDAAVARRVAPRLIEGAAAARALGAGL